MRTALYIVCCIAAVSATLFMCYSIVPQLIHEKFTFRIFADLFGTVGWGYITYGICAKKYKWVQKLCN